MHNCHATALTATSSLQSLQVILPYTCCQPQPSCAATSSPHPLSHAASIAALRSSIDCHQHPATHASQPSRHLLMQTSALMRCHRQPSSTVTCILHCCPTQPHCLSPAACNPCKLAQPTLAPHRSPHVLPPHSCHLQSSYVATRTMHCCPMQHHCLPPTACNPCKSAQPTLAAHRSPQVLPPAVLIRYHT
jgi:hypothetical protein